VNYIDELKEVIRKLHGSFATHVETVPIVESHEGKTVWEGEVEARDRRTRIAAHSDRATRPADYIAT
jgi:hypothetical protein